MRTTLRRLLSLLILLNAAWLAGAQTAHFDGTQANVSSGGVNILAVAIDTSGNVIFTVQNGNAMASVSHPGHGYVPAAFHPRRARRFSDGPRGVTAQLLNASSCTYSGPGSALLFQPANSTNLYLMSGLNAPSGLAFDASGNLYVLDAYSGAIYEYVAVNGTVDPSSAPNFIMTAPGENCANGDMAIDSYGNLYYTTSSGNSVEEVLAVNGVISQSSAVQSLGSGFNYPIGIAVDKQGNVYVADAMNNAIKELVAVNGSIPATPTILNLGSGFNLPAGLAVDRNGNVYVSDYSNNELKEMLAVNGSIPASPIIEDLGSFNQTEATALDGNGDIFVGDSVNGGGNVAELLMSAMNFGRVNVAAASPAMSAQFTFDSGGTLGGISVLTNGVSGLDFTDAGSGTCISNTTYAAGQSCTVAVNFTPRFSGTRNGAVVLTGAGGSVVATAYLQGTGVGPQATFTPGAESAIPVSGNSAPLAVAVDGAGTLFVVDNRNGLVLKESPSAGGYAQTTIASGLSDPWAVAVDGAGNLYIADTGNMRVLKETPTASGYVQSTVDSGFGYPYGVAVDSSGKVYVADNTNNRILAETPSLAGYTESTVASGMVGPMSVAVDASGNLYIAVANNGPGYLLKETLSNGSYTQTTIPAAGQIAPQSIAVDAMGNVYFEDASTNDIFRETPTPSGYVESPVVTDLQTPSGPWGIAIDASGNVYTGYPPLNEVVKVDFADAPALSFANSQVGATSADSPQTVTLNNYGNAALVFPLPATGNNPSIGPDFTLNATGQSDCPLLTSQSSSPATLAGGASCDLSVSFAPTVAGTLAESLAVTDNSLNAASPAYATQSITLAGSGVNQTTSSITWPSPAAITYGTPLGDAQLDATASVPGTFSYSPAAGTLLGAGSQTLTVTFTPTDTTDYTTATATVTLTVNQATPAITWNAPAAITYGTALGSAQLDASSTVGGTFTYSPAAGTVLSAGTSTLTATFTPTDSADYTTATASVSLTITRATPTLTWPAPAPIVYGTPLSATQLNATASVAGTFTYSPAAGAVLSAGAQVLSVTFTPSDSTDYNPVATNVSLTVNKATPAITWPTPASIVQGTPLSSTQLDATASVQGTFVYSPAAGTVLAAGSQTLTTAFTPADTADYTSATASVVLQVTPPPSFTLAASSGSVTVVQGKRASDTITVVGQNGFNSPVTLSISGLPSGVTATFSPNPTSGSSVLTLSASPSAKVGTYSVTVTGVSGSLSARTTISLNVAHK